VATQTPRAVLVTGSSGQLGAEICRQLRDASFRTVGIDLGPGPYTDHLLDVRAAGAVLPLVRDAAAVIHTAALHAPHVGVASRREFVEVNVGGTVNLLESAARTGVRHFVYTSTTSVYGHAMEPEERAVWVTEELTPQPRDIYDVTKLAAEDFCRESAGPDLTVTCLRTCRYFPEDPRTTAVHRLYRGADVRDIAAAHVLALSRTGDPFELLNVAASYRFEQSDLEELLKDAPPVIARRYPGARAFFASRDWGLPSSIDRVYVSDRARAVLGYRPQFDFEWLVASGNLDVRK
jgi:UDP-glucose 4-epimerase